jgi:hypothetical protein
MRVFFIFEKMFALTEMQKKSKTTFIFEKNFDIAQK